MVGSALERKVTLWSEFSIFPLWRFESARSTRWLNERKSERIEKKSIFFGRGRLDGREDEKNREKRLSRTTFAVRSSFSPFLPPTDALWVPEMSGLPSFLRIRSSATFRDFDYHRSSIIIKFSMLREFWTHSNVSWDSSCRLGPRCHVPRRPGPWSRPSRCRSLFDRVASLSPSRDRVGRLLRAHRPSHIAARWWWRISSLRLRLSALGGSSWGSAAGGWWRARVLPPSTAASVRGWRASPPRSLIAWLGVARTWSGCWVTVSVSAPARWSARGCVFACASRNLWTLCGTTARRDSSSAWGEIRCSASSQSVGKCVDMPALRAFSFKFTFALRLFAFCQCFAQFFWFGS